MSNLHKSNTSLKSIFDSYHYHIQENEDDYDKIHKHTTSTTATSLAMTPNPSTGINLDTLQLISHNVDFQDKNIIILVGLPATGKSTISKLLTTHLNGFTDYKTQIYNCGQVRRQILHEHDDSDHKPESNNDNKGFHSYEFFDPSNKLFKIKRELIAIQSLNTLIQDLSANKINVGILDATNTTVERRANLINLIHNKVTSEGLSLNNLMILDIQCDDPRLIKYNINAKTNNDDYRNYDANKSIEDFTKRLDNYNKAYQPITNQELSKYGLSSYIRISNGGETYKFENSTKNDLITILERFLVNYSNYDTKVYHNKVRQFYQQIKQE